MNALLLATAYLALISPIKAPVTVHVDAKNGDSITGEHTFRVTVDAQNLVTQVEFYYNDDLRDKATSTPYKFTVDTLNESDGPAKLKFKAYTSEGETGEATVSVTIDNGLGQGADVHIKKGQTALEDGKWDVAINEGRIAIKIDDKSNAARLIVARAYMHKSAFDKAQKFAEDVTASDPNNPAALDILSVINLQKAFTTFNRGSGDRNDTLKEIGDAMKAAVESRKKALDIVVDSMPAPTDQTLIPYVDAAIRAGRYSLAINYLTPAFLKDNRRNDIANRLAYAQIRLGKYSDAVQTLVQLKKYGTLDVYAQALNGVLFAEAGDVKASDDSIREAILSDADNPIVSTSQAYIALKFVRARVVGMDSIGLNYDDLTGKDTPGKIEARNTLSQILRQLAKDRGEKSEVNYYICALNNKLENYDAARQSFEKAVLTEPANYDAFIEQANKSITISMRGKLAKDETTFLYENARVMFNAALAGRPSSAAALTGLSLVESFEDKSDSAVKWGEAAVAAEVDYAPGYIALSCAYTLASANQTNQAYVIRQAGLKLDTNSERQENELKARAAEALAQKFARQANDALIKGQKLDKKIQGSELTKAKYAWRYFNVGGRVPVLPMP
ncbi:MAG: Ig-like domain-containing protein [Fimbriimonas sp.]|nr:Ig-like domain-containing protein [Fimbriimonas sp.]